MAYRTDLPLVLDNLALRLAFSEHEPANQLQQPARSEPSADPEEAERWLRWLKISFGCETG